MLQSSKTFSDVTLSATGFTTTVTVTASLTEKLNQVTVNIPEVTGTSNSSGFTLTGLPKWTWPAVELSLSIPVATDDGSSVQATAAIGTDGVITLTQVVSGAPEQVWTNSGTKGISATSLTWLI